MHKSGKPVSERANQDVLSLVNLAATTGRQPTNQELYFAGITKPEFNIILKQHEESRMATDDDFLRREEERRKHPFRRPVTTDEPAPEPKVERPSIFQRLADKYEGVNSVTGELNRDHPARYKWNPR